MLITEVSSKETPAAAANDDDDDDDEISILYANPPSDNKGKAKAIEIDDDDEIQLLFATTCKNKRKAFIHHDDEVVILAETLVQQDQFSMKKKFMLDLNNSIHFDDDDDDVQVIYSFPKVYPGEFSNSKRDIVKKHNSSGDVDVDVDVDADDGVGDLSLLIMCEICADEKPKRKFVTVMGCDHSYCSECVARYVASRLEENVVEITCPVSKCEGVLGLEHCRSFLPSRVYDRWGAALCEEIISPLQKFYCPYKDCSALMIDDTEETGEVITQMECPNCRRMFCVKCKAPWHDGVECDEFQMLNEDDRGEEDIMLVNLAKENLWKRCPMCKMYVQRSQGCNSMRCRCGCSFCYACGGAYPRCHCMRGYAHQLPVGGHPYAINQAGHILPLFNIPANHTLDTPPFQFRQGPVESHSNASLQARAVAHRHIRRHRSRNLPADQTQSDASIQFPQGPVGGHGNAPNVQQLEQIRLQMMNGLQNPSANQTQSNLSQFWQGPVGGGDNIPNASQGLVGGPDNTANSVGGRGNTPNARQLAQMQLPMMNGLHNLLANQTQSNTNIPPLFASVARTNEFSQTGRSLPNQTRSRTNIQPPGGFSFSHQ